MTRITNRQATKPQPTVMFRGIPHTKAVIQLKLDSVNDRLSKIDDADGLNPRLDREMDYRADLQEALALFDKETT